MRLLLFQSLHLYFEHVFLEVPLIHVSIAVYRDDPISGADGASQESPLLSGMIGFTIDSIGTIGSPPAWDMQQHSCYKRCIFQGASIPPGEINRKHPQKRHIHISPSKILTEDKISGVGTITVGANIAHSI